MPETKQNSMYGFVAKVLDSKLGIIRVFVPELTPFEDGTFSEETSDISVTVKDINDNTVTRSVILANTIVAEYFHQRSGVDMPDIHAQELVELFQYGETSKFYWQCPGRNDSVRHNEHYRIRCANKKVTIKDLDDDNTYYFEIDTRDNQKHITLSTSNSDNEAHKYKFEINPDSSTVLLNDETGNEIFLETEVPRIRLLNNKETFVDLNAEDLICSCNRDMRFHAGRQIVWVTPLITTESVDGEGITELRANNMTITCDNTFNVKASCVGMQCVSFKSTGVGIFNGVYSTSYSIGTVPSAYASSTINTEDGIGTTNNNTPDLGGGTANARHCTAYEDYSEATEVLVDAINTALNEINPAVQINKEAIMTLVANTIMEKNMGE